MSALPPAILLDALGTLVELEPPAPRLREELAERFAIKISESQAAHALAQEIAYYRAHLDEGSDDARLAALRARCADVLRQALPPSAALRRVKPAELEAALLSSLRFNAFEDALPALSALRARGVSLVVVSNWDISLRGVLERTGLASLLDGIVTSAEAGSRKPDAQIFRRGLELVSAAASDACHVGDSVAEDVMGARRAGIEPILISRSGGRGPGDVLTIRALSDLLS